jgi:hypothetical protein
MDARYLTLHGGMSALGEDYVCLQQELATLGSGLFTAALRVEGTREKARQAKTLATTRGGKIDKPCFRGSPWAMCVCVLTWSPARQVVGHTKDCQALWLVPHLSS